MTSEAINDNPAANGPVTAPEPSLDSSGRPRGGHFDTDDLVGNLGKRSISSGKIAVAASGASFLLQFVTLALLGRLLTQEDFGLIAMVTAFTAFITTIRDLGLGQASIQSDETNHSNASTLFWLNGTMSLIAAVGLGLLGPFLSRFYGQPELSAIAVTVGLSLALSGFSSQHIALLQRRFRHKTVAIIRVASQCFGSIIAVAVAFAGAGYWALVVLPLGQSFFTLIAAWSVSGWRPGTPKWDASVKAMLVFSLPLVGSELLATAMRNVDLILIGKVIGAAEAGVYLLAYRILLMPIRQINTPLATVALPTFSRLKDDPVRFQRMYRKAIAGICLASMPLVGGAFATAPAFIPLVFGDGWTDSVYVFLALGPAALLATYNVAGSWAASPCGFTGRLFKWGLVGPPLTIAAYFLGASLGGVVGVALAFSIAQVFLRPFALWYILRPTPVGLSDIHLATTPPTIAVCIGAGLGWFVTSSLSLTTAMDKFVATAAGGSVFLAVFVLYIFVAPHAKPHRELVHQLLAPMIQRLMGAKRPTEHQE